MSSFFLGHPVHPKQILALLIPNERIVWFLKRIFKNQFRSPVIELVKKVHREIIKRRKNRAEGQAEESADFMDFYLDVEEMNDQEKDEIFENYDSFSKKPKVL